ncbi:MAG: hypothetical protein QM753_06870 [Thermomicrobiales bacterium]
MAVLNYTTQITVAKTIGEVQGMLMEHGADRIMLEYSDKQPVGITFQIDTDTGPALYSLPVDVAAMHQLLVRQSRQGRLKGISRTAAESMEQAARVAWRVIKDWLEAQLALIETRMVALDQVMLPYLRVGELTIYEQYRAQRALTAGGEA